MFKFKCLNSCFCCHLEHVPVKDVVIGEALAVEQVAKQLPQIAAMEKVDKSKYAKQMLQRKRFNIRVNIDQYWPKENVDKSG